MRKIIWFKSYDWHQAASADHARIKVISLRCQLLANIFKLFFFFISILLSRSTTSFACMNKLLSICMRRSAFVQHVDSKERKKEMAEKIEFGGRIWSDRFAVRELWALKFNRTFIISFSSYAAHILRTNTLSINLSLFPIFLSPVDLV